MDGKLGMKYSKCTSIIKKINMTTRASVQGKHVKAAHEDDEFSTNDINKELIKQKNFLGVSPLQDTKIPKYCCYINIIIVIT